MNGIRRAKLSDHDRKSLEKAELILEDIVCEMIEQREYGGAGVMLFFVDGRVDLVKKQLSPTYKMRWDD